MSTPPLTSFAVALPNLAVLRIHGIDARAFLHAQLSNDISQLEPGQVQLNGYFSAQGRLLSTLYVWQALNDTDTFYAMVSAELADSLVKKLSMFVFRSKVKIERTNRPVAGLFLDNRQAPGLEQLIAPIAIALPAPRTHLAAGTDANTLIEAPTAQTNSRRFWLIGPAQDALQEGWPTANPENEERWFSQSIAAGLPRTVAATQELFLAQALNLDLIDAIHFKKGCYPGQEVIARSHYRGTTKRRMVYGTAPVKSGDSTATLPGSDIFDAGRPDSPAGRIVNASRSDNLWHLLLEVRLADLDDASFRVHSADGPAITLQPLPYAVADA